MTTGRRLGATLVLLASAATLLLGNGPAAGAKPVKAGHHHAPRAHAASPHVLSVAKAHAARSRTHVATAKRHTGQATRGHHAAGRPHVRPGHSSRRHAAVRSRGNSGHTAHQKPAAHNQVPARTAPASAPRARATTTLASRVLAGTARTAARTVLPRAHPPRPAAHRLDRSAPEGKQPEAVAAPGAPVLDPLRKVEDGLSRLAVRSLFSGPLGWLLSAVTILALSMIVTAWATGRGAGWRMWRRRRVSTVE